MSEMEPEVRNYLAKIATTLSASLLWLLVNTTLGIRFNFAFFDERPTIKNYIFYVWFIISLTAMILFFIKKWKA
jgi:hypothetical protein